ncbi:hypothetical protein [Streptomyces sp. NPDC059564]|uniref:hypothetical protein n=1 Tax=Streptomyces sp. NPDC059564 TaxID=3346865 RepID=UPI00367E13EC
MPQSPSTPLICRDCDGFATATITTGTHSMDGTRTTIPVNCPTCQGLGHTARPALARLSR